MLAQRSVLRVDYGRFTGDLTSAQSWDFKLRLGLFESLPKLEPLTSSDILSAASLGLVDVLRAFSLWACP
jgi:hypothetical protein